jgi:hypothetical protein
MLDKTKGSKGGRPRLSVTVLNYNYGHYIEHCLRSILSQSYTDFEVIVIDDCSTDDSIHAIEPFLQDARVRLIAHTQNAGFVRSLIEGTEASWSPYLTVISADDFVLSATAFERQMALLEANPNTSFCYGSWIQMNSETEQVGDVVPYSEDHVWSGEREFKEFCTRLYVLHTGTILRRTAYQAVGGYDATIRYTLDCKMWSLLCGAGDVAFVAEPLYAYRTHGANMSRSLGAVRATTDELIDVVEVGFANLPDGPVKSDRRLRRRARQIALATVPSMQVFAGQPLEGWRTLAYGARRLPREALFQRRIISLAARTVLGARGFEWFQSLRGGPTPWYKAG